MFDLHKPLRHYGDTPFYAAALLCLIGAVLAFCIRKPRADKVPETIPLGSTV
jgi:hypothetical protein